MLTYERQVTLTLAETENSTAKWLEN